MVKFALNRLPIRHPLLRMRIVKYNRKLAFQEMQPFRLDFTALDSCDWKAVVEEELLTRFQTDTGPLWRVHMVKYPDDPLEDGYRCVLIITFQHCITDGASYLRLFEELLKNLNGVVVDGAENMPAVESLSLLPSLDAYAPSDTLTLKMALQILSFLGKIGIFRRVINRRLTAKLDRAFIERLRKVRAQDPSVEKKTCLIPVEFSAEQTSKLLRLCKEKRVTMHGAIVTIASLALVRFMKGGTWKEPVTVPCSTTLNTRRDLNIPPYHMGPYFSIFKYDITLPPEAEVDFWVLAGKCTRTVHAAITPARVAGGPLEFRIFPGLYKEEQDSFTENPDAPGRFPTYMGFTNLGRVDHLSTDESTAVRYTARFGCSSEQNMGAIFTHNLATFNNKLFWTVVYYRHFMTPEMAGEFVNNILTTIKDLVGEDTTQEQQKNLHHLSKV